MSVFDAKSLHDAVNATMKESNVGADKNAFVVVATTQGAKAIITTKVGQHWEIASYVSIDHEKHIEGGAEVKATW